MMKIATGEGFPLQQGAGMGLDWFSVTTEASGGGSPDLFCYSMFGGIWIYIYIEGISTSVEQRGAHEGGGRAHGGRRAPCLVAYSIVS